MDPTQDPAPEPDLADLADLAAFTDREDSDATERHELIAQELWTALHGLGVTGRLLVMGEDPEVYAGLPRTERRISPGTTAELIGRVPQTSWPHPGLKLRQHPRSTPDPFDVVINNVPFNDLAIHSTQTWEQYAHRQAANTLGSIGLTRPGGLTVLLASSRLLDDPDSHVRREMSRTTQLIGALRLPGGALRRAPGNDATVDLLLLHNDTTAPGSAPFTASIPVTLDGRAVHLNEYYDTHPEHILGTLISRANPWGPPDTTVLPDRNNLAPELRTALAQIVNDARGHGLTPHPTADGPAGRTGISRGAGRQRPPSPSVVPAHDLDTARAVVARLRAHHRADPTRPGRPTSQATPEAEQRGL